MSTTSLSDNGLAADDGHKDKVEESPNGYIFLGLRRGNKHSVPEGGIVALATACRL